MKEKNLEKIIRAIKIVFFYLYILCLIKLLPNILTNDFTGIMFLILSILHIILVTLKFLIKDEKIDYDLFQNTMSIIIYIFIGLIALRYHQSLNNENMIINQMFFKINYVVANIGLLALIFNNITDICNKK